MFILLQFAKKSKNFQLIKFLIIIYISFRMINPGENEDFLYILFDIHRAIGKRVFPRFTIAL